MSSSLLVYITAGVLIFIAVVWLFVKKKPYALHDAAATGDLNLIDRLVGSKFQADALYDHMTALHVAVMKNQLKAAEKLIELGASVNVKIQDNTGYTPLHLAATTGNKEMIDLLTANSADILVHAANEETPLYTAARYGHMEAVKHILSIGSKLEKTNILDGSMLFRSIFSNDLKAADILLSAGLSPDVQNDDKRAYALHAAMVYAIHTDNHDMVNCLLEHGADPNVKDQHGMTPLKMARIDNRESLCDLLRSFGAEA